jgi:hypothetical protein
MADKNKFEAGKNEGYKIFNLILSRYFNLIVLTIILIVFAVSYYNLINPKRQKILEERENILSEKIAQKEKLQNIFARIQKYQADYKNISDSDKEKIKNIFIGGLEDKKLEKEKLFSFFENFIYSQGLVLKSIDIADISQAQKDKTKKTDSGNSDLPADVGQVAITFDIVGVDYKSFKNLLDKVEKNLPVMDITDLSFSPQDSGANLKITSYYYKQ